MIFLKGKLGSEYLVLLLGFFIANWAFAGAGEQMLPERCNAVLLADTFPRLTSYDVQARNLGEKEKSATLSADGFQLFFNESLSLQQQAKIFKAFKSLLANEDKNFNHKHMNIYRTMAGEWVRQKYYRDLMCVTRSKVLEIKDEDALFYFNLRYKWLSELVTSRYPGMSLEQHCEMGTVAAVFEIRVDGTD